MRKALIVALAAQLSLSACTAIEGARPDISSRPMPSRLDEIAYINTLRSAFELDKSELCFDGEDLPEFKSKSAQGYRGSRDTEQFLLKDKAINNQCLKFKQLAKGEQGKLELESYLQAGFGLTDIYCHRFFTVAIASQQNRTFARSELASADALVGAVLGVAGAGTMAMTITNSAFGFGGKTLEGYDAAYLVAPDMPDVERLVTAELMRIREDLRKRKPAELPTTYQHARAVIESYARTCSFSGMRQLVSKSIKDRTDALNKPQPGAGTTGGTTSTNNGWQESTSPNGQRSTQPSDRPDLANPSPL